MRWKWLQNAGARNHLASLLTRQGRGRRRLRKNLTGRELEVGAYFVVLVWQRYEKTRRWGGLRFGLTGSEEVWQEIFSLMTGKKLQPKADFDLARRYAELLEIDYDSACDRLGVYY